MDTKYGRYDDIPKNDRDDIYAVVDVFTEIRFRTKDYINTTKLFLTNINSETNNLWKMISIIKSGIAPIEKEPEAIQFWNGKKEELILNNMLNTRNNCYIFSIKIINI